MLRSAQVARPLEETFEVFTRQIGAWWPLPTHGIFGADAGGLGFEDGLLVERAVDGRTSVWGEVLAWDPPHRVVVTWHPGQEAAEASEVEVRFAASDGGGTRVELEHRGWERFGDSAMRRRHGYVGPGAWGHVLDHFADVADARPDAADLTAVAAAYDAFFAEAERGGFGEPPPGEWDAGRVLAHVALNDLAMTAVAQALVQGRTDLAFGNTTCQDPQVLTDWVAAPATSRPSWRAAVSWRGCRWPPPPGSTPSSWPHPWRAGCSTTVSWCSTHRCRGGAWPPRPRRACTCRRTPASCATCGDDLRSP